ncbi:MAG: hypothetical protein HQL59_02335 [Magnetococcales bacterium]|nr:hypothetical protein [Magnetococcales bacterium]
MVKAGQEETPGRIAPLAARVRSLGAWLLVLPFVLGAEKPPPDCLSAEPEMPAFSGRAAAPVTAAPVVGVVDTPTTVVERKLDLLRRVLAESETLRRATLEGHTESASLLEEARLLAVHAERSLADSGSEEARQLVDAAMERVTRSSRLSTPAGSRSWWHRARFDDLWESLASFLEALGGEFGNEPTPAAHPSSPGWPQTERIPALVAEARTLASGGDFEAANRPLAEAHGLAMEGLREWRRGREEDIASDPVGAEEAFAFEQRLEAGLQALVRLTLNDSRPSREARKQIESAMVTSADRAEAGRQAVAAGEMVEAARFQAEANAILSRALRDAGVVVP